MKRVKEQRMKSYVIRGRKLVLDGEPEKAAEMIGNGLNYYSTNILEAITPYSTADAGLISAALYNMAENIEKKNQGAKELRVWIENNTEKPEFREIVQVKKPNME